MANVHGPFCARCRYEDIRILDFPCNGCEYNSINMNRPSEWVSIDGIPEIKDSGDRTIYPTGFQRDMHKGKGRMDLLPWNAIMQISKLCESGAIKYGEHNIDLGCPVSNLMDSGLRHAAKFIAGQMDEAHLTAACWNLLWALEMTLTHKEMVDIPWRPTRVNESGDGR